MNITALSQLLEKHFFVSIASIKYIARIVFALIQTRDVNLTGIAIALNGTGRFNASYRSLQKFISGMSICYISLAKFLISAMGAWSSRWLIAIDRTNWKFGSLDINIFMLSICWNTIAIPILWIMLDKAGTSNTSERKDLIGLFVQHFGVDRISGLIGDREFIGDEWMSYLHDMKIPFYLRIKDGMKIADIDKARSYNELLHELAPSTYIVLEGLKKLGQARSGPPVFIAALKKEDGELVIVATNDRPENALKIYKRRWEIETLFSCLKTRGFNLENTHLVHLDRIRKLVALVSIAFVIAYKIGLWQHSIEPIKLKKHGKKAKSFFRYGLDYMRITLFNYNKLTSVWDDIMTIISKPPQLYIPNLLMLC